MLPKQVLPVYTATIPSTKQKYKFKPFTTKHDNALLLAQQSEDIDTMVDTILDVLRDRIDSDVDVDNLATFDIEKMYLDLRAKSVGEIVELIFSCDVCDEPDAKVKISFNLNDINVEYNPKHTNRIELFGDVGLVMKYPKYNSLKLIKEGLDEEKIEFDLILDCIDYIFEGNQIHYLKDYTEEEIKEFFDEMSKENFQKIYTFFETMPVLVQRVKYTCPKCGKQHNKIIEGIEYFF